MNSPESPNPTPPISGHETLALIRTLHEEQLGEQESQQATFEANQRHQRELAERIVGAADHQGTTLQALHQALLIEGVDDSQLTYRTIPRAQDAPRNYLIGKDGAAPVTGFETRRSVLIPFGEINPSARDGKTHGYAEIFIEEATHPVPGKSGKGAGTTAFEGTGIITGGGIRIFAGQPDIPEPSRTGEGSRNGLTVVTEISAGPVFQPKHKQAMQSAMQSENGRMLAESRLIYNSGLATYLATESPEVRDEQAQIIEFRDKALRINPDNADVRTQAAELCLTVGLDDLESRLELADSLLAAVMDRAIYDGPLYAPHTPSRKDRADRKTLEKHTRIAIESTQERAGLEAKLQQLQEEIGARWAEDIREAEEDADSPIDVEQDKKDKQELAKAQQLVDKAITLQGKRDHKLRATQDEIGARWAEDIERSMIATRSGRRLLHDNDRLF